MKKIGILIFAAAVILGVSVSSFFSFGKLSQNFFKFSFNKKIAGSGNVATEKRDIRGFSGIEVGGIFQVEVISQNEFGVEIEADDNIIPLIRTEVRGGVLRIETERRISSENGLKIRVSAPEIDSVESSGIAKVNVTGIKNEGLHVDSSGASKVSLSGETTEVAIDVSGASSVNGENLVANAANIDSSGASQVSVFTTGRLRANASGASRIIYFGKPSNIEKSTSGASSVREK